MENHHVSEQAKQKRLKLAHQWNDSQIYDCTDQAAAFVLFYKLVEKDPGKDSVLVGKTLFFWDSLERDFLHCLSQQDEKVYRTLDIHSDGTLHYDGGFFNTPQAFLDSLTEKNHLIYKRVPILPGKGLDQVLHGGVDKDFVFQYPPDFPPLLLECALANNDYATAQQILENPSIEVVDKTVKNFRKIHLLKGAIECAIFGKHPTFLKYLLDKYALLDPTNDNFLEPIKGAVISGQRLLFLDLLKKYPLDQFSRVYTYSFEVAVDAASKEFLVWMPENLNKDFKFQLEEAKRLSFLSKLFRKCGPQYFEDISKKLKLEIPWVQLIAELVKFPGNPEAYLSLYQAHGGSVEHLNGSLQIDLLLRAIKEKHSTADIKRFIALYPSFNNVLEEALLQSMADEYATGILIDLGAKPTMNHFEKLLHVSTLGVERTHRFLKLLSGINHIEDAQQTLTIASAYGTDALAAVLEKFPELSKNREFLLSQLQHAWKGAAIAGKQLTSDILTVKREDSASTLTQKPTQETKSLVEKFSVASKVGIGMTMEILIDILAAEGRIDKIKEILLLKPEFIFDFWWRLLFAFQINIRAEELMPLAKETFPLIDERKREMLLLGAFRYFNESLAYLWMSSCTNLCPKTIIDCFKTGFPSGDPAVVDVLTELGHLNVRDENENTLLHFAVEENVFPLVSRLMEKEINPELENTQGDKAFDIALKHERITACRIIRGFSSLDLIAERWICLEAPEIRKVLILAFLNSQSSDVLHVLSKMRSLKVQDTASSAIFDDVEHYMRYPGTLIVRYPRPFEQFEVFTGYNTGQSTYEELQYSWGQRCEELYQEFYAEFKNTDHSMFDTFQKFAKSRAHLKGYEVWRMGYYNPSLGLTTNLNWRYFIYWHLAIKVYKALLSDSSKFSGSLRLVDSGYQVLFSSPLEKEPIGLTRNELKKPHDKGLFRAQMIHTFPNEVKRVLPYLSTLFEEIKNFPKGSFTNQLPPELKKKIAYFFWLGTQATITERGNAQYMLMLHRLLYNLHGFQTAPWNPLYVQPDCIALLLPFELFYEKYYDALFDYPPFPCLNL